MANGLAPRRGLTVTGGNNAVTNSNGAAIDTATSARRSARAPLAYVSNAAAVEAVMRNAEAGTIVTKAAPMPAKNS